MIDWGSVPDWIAAGAGLFAVVFAAVAGLAAFKAYKIQKMQLNSLFEDKRQEQASKVATWIEEHGDRKPVIVILNSSDLPIFAVDVRVVDEDSDVESRITVPPGRTEITLEEQENTGSSLVAILFCDAARNWWVRSGGGVLYEIPFEDINFFIKKFNDSEQQIELDFPAGDLGYIKFVAPGTDEGGGAEETTGAQSPS